MNQFLLQYFITYQLKKGWYITSPIITANWKDFSGNAWTTPLGVGVSRVEVGAQPINIISQFYGVSFIPTARRIGAEGCK